MGWVDPQVGFGWVRNGSRIFVFSGLGWVVGLKWQICEKLMCTYVTVLSSNVLLRENLQFDASVHLLYLSETYMYSVPMGCFCFLLLLLLFFFCLICWLLMK